MRRLFDVVPYGDRWSVSSGGEPLIITRTKSVAKHLAAEARRSLKAVGSPRAHGPAVAAQPSAAIPGHHKL